MIEICFLCLSIDGTKMPMYWREIFQFKVQSTIGKNLHIIVGINLDHKIFEMWRHQTIHLNFQNIVIQKVFE